MSSLAEAAKIAVQSENDALINGLIAAHGDKAVYALNEARKDKGRQERALSFAKGIATGGAILGAIVGI
ncbi:MAG: hypothetical protein ACR2Q4_09665 [Geminicoccaceae bacterium]